MNRKVKSELEELHAEVEHLEERVDNLRENIYYSRNILWNNINDLLAWALKFDKKSSEYKRLCTTSLNLLDTYLEDLLIKKD